MLINKKKNSKPGQYDRIVYISLFTIFIGSILLSFVYSVKFIGQAMNSTFSNTEFSTVEEKYGQLHLEKYKLVANKLGLSGSTISAKVVEEITTEELGSLETEEATIEEIETEALELAESEAEEPVVIPEVSPRIIIINSTQTSGLAADLRDNLRVDNFNVISIGSSRDNLPQTLIKAKSSYGPSSQYLNEIKKIVSLQYDFETAVLEEEAEHDIEIIIGVR